MTSEFVRAGEFLAAPRVLASMRLLASVSADVSRLVLEAVEGLVAQGALVGTRQLVGVLCGLAGERTLWLQLVELTETSCFHGVARNHVVVLIGIE